MNKFFIFFFACLACFNTSVAAAESTFSKTNTDQWVTYTVQLHDNLNDLTQHFLASKKDMVVIQTLNKIKDPNLLPVGKKLHFPRNLLKFSLSKALVLASNCATEAASLENGVGLSAGISLTEGQVVEVPVGCAVDIQLDDGSQIRLPSNSTVKLTRLRHNELESSPEVLLDLIKGRVSLEVHKPRSTGTPFEVQTPISLMGVRGTEFSVSLDDQSGTRLEVTGGKVQSQGIADNHPQLVVAGQGLFINPTGNSQIPETLPGQPVIQEIKFAKGSAGVQIKLSSQPGSDHWLVRQSGIANQVEGAKPSRSTDTIDLGLLGVDAKFLSVTGATPSDLLGSTEQFAVCVPAEAGKNCQVIFEVSNSNPVDMTFSLNRLDDGQSKQLIVKKHMKIQDGRFMLRGLPAGEYTWELHYSALDKNQQPLPIQHVGHFHLLPLSEGN